MKINIEEGFGFIKFSPENIYFNKNRVQPESDFERLKEGTEIKFSYNENAEKSGSRGPYASSVTISN